MIKLSEALRLPSGPKRTARLAAWFQGLYPEGSSLPILVGGSVVELLTGGAYTTGDLDFVGTVPPSVEKSLETAGFKKEGRHWILEREQIYIELPSSALRPEERTVQIRAGGASVLALSPEDILVDRLASWKFWKSGIDGINAFLIWRRQARRMDRRRLAALVRAQDLSDALSELLSFAKRKRGRRVSAKELEEWSARYR